MSSWAMKNVPTRSVGDSGLKQWTFALCLEGDCVPLDVDVPAFGGYGTRYHTLYHPPTGRLVSVLVISDDLGRMLR
jgi:hypothetical protein